MIGGLWLRFRRALERAITGQSLQARLASLTGFSVALAVLLVGSTAYLVARWSLLEQLDDDLLNSARSSAEVIGEDLESLGGITTEGLSTTSQLLALVSAQGNTRQPDGQSLKLPTTSEDISIARTQDGFSARSVVLDDGTAYRLVTVPLTVVTQDEVSADTQTELYAVMFARPLTSLTATLSSMWRVMVVAGLVGIVVTTLAARFVAQTTLAPVRRLSAAVTAVTNTDKLTPIRIYGRDDLGDLTKSFNAMLRSLQTSRERQRQLIADAGHELRTPLTSMRTNIELLVADDKSGMLPEGARSEILDDVSAQLGEFSALVGDLVALTRDDHLQREPEELDFGSVIESALERAQRRGPGIHFDVELDHSVVLGDASTLERAITNLLDNAVKFSPEDGTIEVRLVNGVLTVVDQGPGIAEEDLPHIFDRFYRSDRARNTPGTGLGLSIVAHTADVHGGAVRAGNQPGAGAIFTMRLPTIDPIGEVRP